MRFAKGVFLLAGVSGVLMMVPPFFMESKTGEDYPPPIHAATDALGRWVGFQIQPGRLPHVRRRLDEPNLPLQRQLSQIQSQKRRCPISSQLTTTNFGLKTKMTDASNSPANVPLPTAKPKNHGWIYFFVFVFGASVFVALFMIWYNRSIQLTPDQLEAAKKLWQDSNIKNYNMVYKKKLLNDQDWTTFLVRVLDGRVKEVLMNGRPLKAEGNQDPLPYHSMDAQFRYLERFLDLDQKPNASKVYFVADFDQRTGAIIRYTRYDSSKQERVEMLFNLQILVR